MNQPTPQRQPPLPYSVTRLAEESGVPKRTIIRHINNGTLPAVKLGTGTSAWVIPAEAAEAYIAQHAGQDTAA